MKDLMGNIVGWLIIGLAVVFAVHQITLDNEVGDIYTGKEIIIDNDTFTIVNYRKSSYWGKGVFVLSNGVEISKEFIIKNHTK